VRRGDRDAEFVDFTRRHRAMLVRTATLLCAGDSGYAEDLVQTTLTRLYLSWSRVRRADSPLAYARASLTHAFVDENRRAHRRRETAWGGTHDLDPHAPAVGDQHDLRDVVREALAALGPRQRAVIVLRHFHDLDVAETARLLGCSEGTVKSQNARAIAHLRSHLTAGDVHREKEHQP
jgi:RNA polymerase sigma-70 factor (sigma-E family)